MYCGYLLWKWINNVAANVTQHVVHISTTHNEQNTHRTLTYLKHIIHHTFEHSQVLYRSVYKWYQYWQTDCVNAACSLYVCARYVVRAFSPFMITGLLRDNNYSNFLARSRVCIAKWFKPIISAISASNVGLMCNQIVFGRFLFACKK